MSNKGKSVLVIIMCMTMGMYDVGAQNAIVIEEVHDKICEDVVSEAVVGVPEPDSEVNDASNELDEIPPEPDGDLYVGSEEIEEIEDAFEYEKTSEAQLMSDDLASEGAIVKNFDFNDLIMPDEFEPIVGTWDCAPTTQSPVQSALRQTDNTTTQGNLMKLNLEAQDFTMETRVMVGENVSICFRVEDERNYYAATFKIGQPQFVLSCVKDGITTTVASKNADTALFNPGVGYWYDLTIEAQGNEIKFFIVRNNRTQSLEWTDEDSTYTSGTFMLRTTNRYVNVDYLNLSYTEPPVPPVLITSPEKNTKVACDTDIKIEATAADTTISKAEVYNGDELLGEAQVEAGECVFLWRNVEEQNAALTVRVYDGSGGVETSPVVNLQIIGPKNTTAIDNNYNFDDLIMPSEFEPVVGTWSCEEANSTQTPAAQKVLRQSDNTTAQVNLIKLNVEQEDFIMDTRVMMGGNISINFRVLDEKNYYSVTLKTETPNMTLATVTDGKSTTVKTASPTSFTPGVGYWYDLRIEAKGNVITYSVTRNNNTEVLEWTDPDSTHSAGTFMIKTTNRYAHIDYMTISAPIYFRPTNVTFSDGMGSPVSALTSNQTLKAQTEFKNNSGITQNAIMLLIWYSGDIVKKIAYKTVESNGVEGEVVAQLEHAELQLGELEPGDMVQLHVLKSIGNMQPLQAPLSLGYSH